MAKAKVMKAETPRKVRRAPLDAEIIAEDTVTRFSPVAHNAKAPPQTATLPQDPAIAEPAPLIEPAGPQAFIWYGLNHSIFLTPQDAVLTLVHPQGYGSRGTWTGPQAALKPKSRPMRTTVHMRLLGANSAPQVDARRRQSISLSGASTPAYSEVRFRGVYPGVDIAYQSDPHLLRYSFLLTSGLESPPIRLEFAGCEDLHLEGNRLILKTSHGNLRWQEPLVYQEDRNGRRIKLDAKYVLSGLNEVNVIARSRHSIIAPSRNISEKADLRASPAAEKEKSLQPTALAEANR